MEKSGTRYPILNSPIVERSVAPQSRRQKLAYGAVTVAFWAFWVYLWVPLLALLAWSLGVQQAYKYMIEFGGHIDLVRLVAFYLLVIVLLGGTLLLWAGYNIVRFGGAERRTPVAPVTTDQVARMYNLDAAEIERWQGLRRIVVNHDEQGAISGVETHPAAAPAPG